MLATVGAVQGRQLAQVGILRMQGKDADAAIGIAVGPGVGHGGVVDGQYLEHALARRGHQVGHGHEVAEVAHSETAIGTQGEHRDERAGHALVAQRVEGLVQLVHL